MLSSPIWKGVAFEFGFFNGRQQQDAPGISMATCIGSIDRLGYRAYTYYMIVMLIILD